MPLSLSMNRINTGRRLHEENNVWQGICTLKTVADNH